MDRRRFLAAAAGLSIPALPSFAADGDASTKLYAESKLVGLPRLSVEVVGKGPDLVLIPGLASSRATWKATADRLKDRYRLHLVQVAGFAGEPARANALGEVFAPTAEQVSTYVATISQKPVLLAGHSLGGTMALYLAQQHPEQFSKVLIVDALSFFGYAMGARNVEQARPFAEAMLKQPPNPVANEAMIRTMAQNKADQDMIIGWGRISDPGAVVRAMAEDVVLDLQPGLPALKVPTTVLHPDNVGVTPPGLYHTFYQRAYAGQPAVKLIEIKDSRHFIMFDQPAAFAEAFDAWLAV